jgi:hypothetical protein
VEYVELKDNMIEKAKELVRKWYYGKKGSRGISPSISKNNW